MKQTKESLLLSGQTLYLREHTEQLKIQNIQQQNHDIMILVISIVIFIMIVGLFFYIHYNNVWGNTIRILGGC